VYEEARSAARLAAVLRSSGATAEAGRVAAAARETAARLGARPLIAELTPLVPGLGASAADLLTPREREVLALVAEGLSNRQVGERLFVSTKTASVHVSNILAKLGAHSRTEAASLARRRGLLG
jgi:DNA-binding NarL/FixJ family response regulator